MNAIDIMDLLNENEVGYILHKHPRVYTVEEAKNYVNQQPGGHFKNLFLKRNKKKNEFFLVILQADKQLDFSYLSKVIGCKLSFAKAEVLKDFDVIPGAVSPFVLLEDQDNKITMFVDRELEKYDIVNFHPNDNSMTLGLKREDFIAFLMQYTKEIKWL